MSLCGVHGCPAITCAALGWSCYSRETLRAEFPLEDPIALLRALVEDTPCHYDHDGECQEHHKELRPNVCANGAAREYLILTQQMKV